MAFISSKFNHPTWSSGYYENRLAFTDALLNKFKDAFIAANSNWTLYSDIETIGTYTGIDVGCRTLQLKSSTTGGKYVRIWCFGGQSQAQFVDSPTPSSDNTHLKIYTGNLFKCNNANGAANYAIFSESARDIYFGVSDNPIGVDFGLALDLSLPLFGILPNHTPIATTTSNSFSLSSTSTDFYQSQATTTSVISDGKMFGIVTLRSNKTTALFYAPDMFICANSGDSNREGVFGTSSMGNDFALGSSSSTSPIGNGLNYAIFNQANGGFNFSGMQQTGHNNQNLGTELSDSTKMVTVPVAVNMYPSTYDGSTGTGIIDGIGFKGWVNTDYIRSVNNYVLPASCKGMTYGNGRWLCMNGGSLICWDSSNSSPFEAA